jgi:hypothetical protein
MRLSQNTIQEVKQIPIINIIGRYVQLKKCGNNYRGRCPFHSEHTPSFYVNEQKGYKCFGCDASGSSSINFIMKYEGKSFLEAIKLIAEISGIKIELDNRISKRNFNDSINKSSNITVKSDYSVVPFELFKESLSNFEKNNLITYISKTFGSEIARNLISKYYIGTSNYWNGATIFWQIDELSQIRAGKIILYNPSIGKRIKEPFSHVNWIHNISNLTNFKLNQCFFGEHLLAHNNLPVAIVESEKTALIASICLPKFIWLAVGGINNLSEERFKILKGRNVILYPDVKGLHKWNDKIKTIKPYVSNLKVSNLIEHEANLYERMNGFDLADYLLKHNHKIHHK